MTENSTSTGTGSYLALVPRGLHDVAREWLHQKLAGWEVNTSFLGETVPPDLPITSIQEMAEHLPKKRRLSPFSQCCRHPVGTIPRIPHDVSYGYRATNSEPIWATAGVHEGTVWLLLETNAPCTFIQEQISRTLGPMLSFAGFWDMNFSVLKRGVADSATSMAMDKKGVSSCLHSDGADYRFVSALKLWRDYALASWGLPRDEREDLQKRIESILQPHNHSVSCSSPSMRFRLSNVRTDSKKYDYRRQDFLAEIADIVFPANVNTNRWKVDLTNYDVEIVLLQRPTCLAIGMALYPYQKARASSFGGGGLPPDMSQPYYQPSGPIASSRDIVRLRPSTAQLLLHLCQLEEGDVVLDPCVGIGTIAIETLFGDNRSVVGLGGDLVLDAFGSVASDFSTSARPGRSSGSFAELAAWDACCLPLRASFVDVIVSDLPFGQSCSSSWKLNSFIPLMMSEFARVLKPNTGRMVLLCGSYNPYLQEILRANQEHREASSKAVSVWEVPCDAIFPVNIGGICAWVIQVRRGEAEWTPIANRRSRHQNIVGKRNLAQRHRPGGKPKRLQA